MCTQRDGAITLVTEVDGDVVGFLVYELDREEETGKVLLLAVHPDHQNGGIGIELNIRALEKMGAAGLKLAGVRNERR